MSMEVLLLEVTVFCSSMQPTHLQRQVGINHTQPHWPGTVPEWHGHQRTDCGLLLIMQYHDIDCGFVDFAISRPRGCVVMLTPTLVLFSVCMDRKLVHL